KTFLQKIFWCRERFPSVLRKHSSEGRTPDAAERCIRHCAGSRPPRGTGLSAPIQNVLGGRNFSVDLAELFRRSYKPVLKVCKFGSSDSPRTPPANEPRRSAA